MFREAPPYSLSSLAASEEGEMRGGNMLYLRAIHSRWSLSPGHGRLEAQLVLHVEQRSYQ